MTTKELPVSVGAKLLDINRTSIYYKGTPVSEAELACKEIIDHLHTDNPTWGARQMSAQLKARGYHVGRRKTRRYMNEMDIYPIYPKMNLSKLYIPFPSHKNIQIGKNRIFNGIYKKESKCYYIYRCVALLT